MADVATSAIAVLADYFGAELGVTAREGWPEFPQGLRLADGPVVTITRIGEPRRLSMAPRSTDTSNGSAPLLVAWVQFPLQIDLWCSHRAKRDEVAEAFRLACHNDLPFREGLYLGSTGHHSRTVTVTIDGGENLDEADSVTTGVWRRRWTAQVATDEVVPYTGPVQDSVEIVPQGDMLGDGRIIT